MNLDTWRHDPVAAEIFDPAELARVADDLAAIAEGSVAAPPVRHDLREVVAVRGPGRPSDQGWAARSVGD